MTHLRFGSESLVVVDDDSAEALIDSAAHVAQMRAGDRVDLRGYSEEGNRIITTFLLNSGTDLVAEPTDLPFEDVDDSEAIASMQGRTRELEFSPEFLAGYRAFDHEEA